MDNNSHILNPTLNRIAKRSNQDFLSHQQLYNIGSDLQVSEKQLQNNWSFSPSRANELTRSKIDKNTHQKVNLDWKKQGSDYVTAVEGLLSEGSASKECQNQEMVSRQWNNLMQHRSNEDLAFDKAASFHASPFSPISRTNTALGVSPGSYSSNRSYSGFDYSKASNSGCSMLRHGDIYKPYYFQQSPSPFHNQVPPQGSSLLVDSNGMNMASLEDLKQISGEVLSPEQISSITTCSDADWHRDKELFEIGVNFPISAFSETTTGDSNWIEHGGLEENNLSFYHVNTQSLPGDNMGLDKYNTYLPEQTSLRIPEDDCTLSSMIVSKPESSHNQLSQYGHKMLQSKQCHQWPFPPPVHFVNSLKTKIYGCTVGHEKFFDEVPAERLSKTSQLSLEQLHGLQHQEFRNVQSSKRIKPTDSVLSLHNILYSYLIYKSKLVNASRSQQDFVDHWHLAVCNDQMCECEKYSTLISHFDRCFNTKCNICAPVRKSCLVKQINFGAVSELSSYNKFTSGSGKPKGHLSGHINPIDYSARSFNIEDTQPIPKRMKMENSVQFDDWSLGAVVHSAKLFSEPGHPHLGQWFGGPIHDKKISMKMDNELLNSKETSTTVVSRNGTADNRESENANFCFGMTEEHLEQRLPPEGLGLNNKDSTMVNNEMPSSTEHTGKSLLNNSDASDNQNLGNGNASFYSEVHCLGDRQQERECLNTSKVKLDSTFSCKSVNFDGMPNLPEEPHIGQEEEKIKHMSEAEHEKIDAKCDQSEFTADYPSGMNLKENGAGISLTDFFTAVQIKVHLHSLNPCNNLSVEEESTENRNVPAVDENSCQLCAVDGLRLAPPPMHCTCCGARIKHGLNYYWALDEMGARCCFCTLCFRKSRGGNVLFKGHSFSKANLQKGKNTEENEEAWVKCDKCERWQHQICALYNSKRDLEGKVKYICPFCRLAEIAALEHVPIPPAFEAQDLPRTMLSDHIEQRLFKSLKRERKQRAKLLGKSPEEVPGAADLIIRVVLSVNRQLKVKQHFLDILHGGTYPTEFPYRSKVILLFQKVEGVDVCLFAMYVQEFGSECGQPNQRCVYISYLDSVKYFRPEIKTVTGQALRTFVYHEILIGYLDYCKQRGFTTCYIWACPPLRGDDYILYCHPETQKTPKSDKLGQWYKLMLRKALEEKVVVGYTNFYDYFFVPSGECNRKITAARLPYFDGDYWSGAIEDMIKSIEKDSEGKSQSKVKKLMTKRTLKAMGHSDLSVDATKDILVMQKLGHAILPVKEDFIVVHLQFTCINCHEAILSGSRWSCNRCSNFHLCSRCHDVEQNPGGFAKHTNICGKKHILRQIAVHDVSNNTDDKDVILDNDFFESRQSFLNFCQTNHYQFGTLRRAKHSTMMVLYHLQKMTALTMGTICSICHQDVMVGSHCEICSEFYVCTACYQKEGDGCHIHKLVQHLAKADFRTKSKQMQQQKASEVTELLDLLGHANQCRATRGNPCSYPKCLHVKKLFLHNQDCERRVAGGCNHCKRIWFLLCLHSRNCRDSYCIFPRCLDIKNYKETLETQSELQQRFAITEQPLK